MMTKTLKDLDEVYQKDEELKQEERSRSRMQSEERLGWSLGHGDEDDGHSNDDLDLRLGEDDEDDGHGVDDLSMHVGDLINIKVDIKDDEQYYMKSMRMTKIFLMVISKDFWPPTVVIKIDSDHGGNGDKEDKDDFHDEFQDFWSWSQPKPNAIGRKVLHHKFYHQIIIT